MSYWDVNLLSYDQDIQSRVTACAAVENVSSDPVQWASDHRWQIAAQPGWADAYASALASGVPAPGRDPAVITDAMILSAVQALATP